MYLVTKSKYSINILGFKAKTSEYVYIHEGKEVWREKGNRDLLDYFNSHRGAIEESELEEFPIWNRYSESCDKMGY